MPRDLFAEAGIDPNAPEKRAPRDLFAEAGIDPKAEMPNESLLGKAWDYAKGFANDKVEELANKSWGVQREIPRLYTGGLNTEIAGVNELLKPFGKHINPVNFNSGFFDKNITNEQQANQGAGLLGAIALPELGIAKAVDAIPAVVKNGGALTKAIGSLLRGGVGAAGEGAGYTYLNNTANPNQNPTENVGQNAGLSAALSTILRGGTGAINSVTKLGKRSPQEIQQISDKLGDTPMNIADVSNSKLLKVLSAVGEKIPFSGFEKSRNNMIGKIDDDASNFVNSLKGDIPKEIAEKKLLDHIKENRETHTKISRQKYDAVEEKANNVNVEYTGTQKKAKELLEKYQGGATKLDDSVSRLLVDLSEGKINNHEYKRANVDQSNLLADARQAKIKGESKTNAVYTALSKSILGDMENSLNKHDPNLFKQYTEAKDYYNDNVVPYKKSANSGLYKLLIGKGKMQDLPKAIIGNDDRKIIDHLDDKNKNLLAYTFFKKKIAEDAGSNDIISSPNLINAHSSLPKDLRNSLLNPSQQAEINRLDSITKLSKDARLKSTTIPTGFDFKKDAYNAAKYGGLLYAGTHASLPHVAAASIGTGALANALRRYMENPKTRQAFINQQIVDPKKSNNLTQALIRALANYKSGDNQ